MNIELTEREARVISFALFNLGHCAESRVSDLYRGACGLSPERRAAAIEGLSRDAKDAFAIRDRMHQLIAENKS